MRLAATLRCLIHRGRPGLPRRHRGADRWRCPSRPDPALPAALSEGLAAGDTSAKVIQLLHLWVLSICYPSFSESMSDPGDTVTRWSTSAAFRSQLMMGSRCLLLPCRAAARKRLVGKRAMEQRLCSLKHLQLFGDQKTTSQILKQLLCFIIKESGDVWFFGFAMTNGWWT